MAVIWQKQVAGKHYEVRSAGRTRRLYTDGVFHSQYNPGRTLTGNVWDLISLPAFFLETEQLRRILVLGVGGGAVISQLRHWFPNCHVTGVELDKTHIYIARHFFDVGDENVDLIQADAIDWVRTYRGLPFDLIIDDLFAEQAGEPYRVIRAGKSWIDQLSRLLTSHGMIVMNFISGQELRDSAFFTSKTIQQRFRQAFRFITPLYENNIGAFLKQSCSSNIWRRRIKQHAVLGREYPEYQHKYQLRKLIG